MNKISISKINNSHILINIIAVIMLVLVMILYDVKVVYGDSAFDNCLFIGDSRYRLNGVREGLAALGENVSVRAVSGSRSDQWDAIIDSGSGYVHSETITLPSSASCVSIMLGANCPTQFSETKSVMQKLHNRYPNARIVFNSVYHLGANYTYMNKDEANALYDKFNNEMKAYCEANSDWAAYADVTAGLYETIGGRQYLKSEYRDGSGIHITGAGVKPFVENVKNEVGKALDGSASSLHKNEFCYYDSGELRAILEIKESPIGLFNSGYTDVRIDTVGTTLSKTKNTHVFNWVAGDVINNHNNVTKHKSGGNYIKFEPIYNNSAAALEKTDGTKCPKHLVVQRDKSSYSVWATNDDIIASDAITYINENGYNGYSATFTKNEKKITEEQYYESFIPPELGGEDVKVTCNSLFGDVTDDGSKNDTGTPTLGYMVNKVMQYIRIIVPVLIIILGTIDLAKAALASKEDQMKKAQTDFIKRLLMGVVIFFAPVLVRLVMHLADLVWTGVHDAPCNLP